MVQPTPQRTTSHQNNASEDHTERPQCPRAPKKQRTSTTRPVGHADVNRILFP